MKLLVSSKLSTEGEERDADNEDFENPDSRQLNAGSLREIT